MFSTRIAPSPTGMMHLGTARTALFNWLVARSDPGGSFIVRIDDTDATRNQPEMVQPILDGLEWLGLDYDELFYQSDRLDLYRLWAERLLNKGLASRAENGAVLLAYPDYPVVWTDRVGGAQKINEQEQKAINSLVLLRGDQTPTYHFASTVDDYEMDITYIIRGDDHRINTGKHLAIWCALNAAMGRSKPLFPMTAHVGLIFHNGRKMSKRDGAASLLDYRDQGVDPDAMFNFLLRLGWGPSNENKSHAVIDRERALDLFLDAGKMRAAPASFDEAHLRALDRKHKARKGQ